MNKIYYSLILSGTLLFGSQAKAQVDSTIVETEIEDSTSYVLGEGITLFNQNKKYIVEIGSFIQTFGQVNSNSNNEIAKGVEQELNIRSARVFLKGNAIDEKVSMTLEFDLSDEINLYEAYLSYQINNKLNLSAGQKLTFTNNRSYYSNENLLQFDTRSSLSSAFTKSGREIGLFLEGCYPLNDIIIKPSIAVTSGDGRGARGKDIGGLKYGGRLDVLPLGEFTDNGSFYGVDLARESDLKLAVGGAYSFNNGASDAVGEGQSEFLLYDEDGGVKYADYHKVYGDLLIKYDGISFLAEYANTRVTSKSALYTNTEKTGGFYEESIANYYAVGSAYNLQAGYLFKNDISVDIRYTGINPEFGSSTSSIIKKENIMALGTTKYFVSNGLKLSGSVSYSKQSFVAAGDNSQVMVRLLTQIMF